MSIQELQARFRRQHQEHAAWRLLRAENAPLILAYVSDLFGDTNDVPFGRAKAALDTELNRWREQGEWETDVSAGAYLRQWIQAGWLRELDDQLTKTDACEVVLRFCQSLEQREASATASHLRIVQDAVRDLAVDLSPNAEERIALLAPRQAALQREIDDLHAGVVIELSEAEQRERIREVYQLASVLTGDFRRVEDEIRHLDQFVRVQMIEAGSSRGAVLLDLLEQEELLADSDAGRAFHGFFQLLCDQNRSTEFREQLRSILNHPAADHLTPQQSRFLGQLMRELTRESERVFQVRRRTEESLRTFIESGAHLENLAVDRLLGQLERSAVLFKEVEISLRTVMPLRLPSGRARLRSPDSWCLRMPEEQLDTRHVQTQPNAATPTSTMLDHLHTVKLMAVATQMRDTLTHYGPLTLAGLVKHHPLTVGLEELVAYLRVAQAVGATQLEAQESVIVNDRHGEILRASIPGYLLHAKQFPQQLEELAL